MEKLNLEITTRQQLADMLEQKEKANANLRELLKQAQDKIFEERRILNEQHAALMAEKDARIKELEAQLKGMRLAYDISQQVNDNRLKYENGVVSVDREKAAAASTEILTKALTPQGSAK